MALNWTTCWWKVPRKGLCHFCGHLSLSTNHHLVSKIYLDFDQVSILYQCSKPLLGHQVMFHFGKNLKFNPLLTRQDKKESKSSKK